VENFKVPASKQKDVGLAYTTWSMKDLLQAPDLVKSRNHCRIQIPKTPCEGNDVADMMLYQTVDYMVHAPFCTSYKGRIEHDIQILENIWTTYKYEIYAWHKRRLVWTAT
jgi:hypothetical protein